MRAKPNQLIGLQLACEEERKEYRGRGEEGGRETPYRDKTILHTDRETKTDMNYSML